MLQTPKSPLPIPVRSALRKLGSDIRDARRRRRIPAALMAERVLVTRATLHKAERGDPTVSVGTYATALFILGMTERLPGLPPVPFVPLGPAPGDGGATDTISPPPRATAPAG